MNAGRKLGLQPAIEVHRDTCTETPEKTFALADAYQRRYKEKLRINFDHSHPAIIKQVRAPNYWEPKTNARPGPAEGGGAHPFQAVHRQPLPDSGDQRPRPHRPGFRPVAGPFPAALCWSPGSRGRRAGPSCTASSSSGLRARGTLSSASPTYGRTPASPAARSKKCGATALRTWKGIAAGFRSRWRPAASLRWASALSDRRRFWVPVRAEGKNICLRGPPFPGGRKDPEVSRTGRNRTWPGFE